MLQSRVAIEKRGALRSEEFDYRLISESRGERSRTPLPHP